MSTEVLEGREPLRFVRIRIDECIEDLDAPNWHEAAQVLRTPQEFRLAEGMIVLAGHDGTNAGVMWIKDGVLR